MQINIRKLSKERIINFEKIIGKKINVNNLQHMFFDKNSLDLSKAKNWLERSGAERITVEPMRQSRGENEQLVKLNNAFGNVEKYKPGTLFLHKSKIYDQTNVPSGIRTDIDAVIEEQKCIVLLSLKKTHSNHYKGGGSQNAAFDQIISLINQAPLKSNKSNLWLGIYLSGDFWSVEREKYQTFKNIKFPTTCFEIVKKYAEKKKCIVFTDKDLPKKKTTFYNWFLK